MSVLKKQLSEINSLLSNSDTTNEQVSSKGVFWHLEHSLRVIIGVCKSLKNSDPKAYRWKFNHFRTGIYLLNYIPRGKARAPKVVLPPDKIDKEHLIKKLLLAQKELDEIKGLNPKSNFMHPYFGMLDLKNTFWFLKLHTEHHLKICRDIIK